VGNEEGSLLEGEYFFRRRWWESTGDVESVRAQEEVLWEVKSSGWLSWSPQGRSLSGTLRSPQEEGESPGRKRSPLRGVLLEGV
jgi:hypothetical protein